ncbi:hypothetical protein QFZ98_004841 [Paraburkholderia youngii]
MPCAARLAASSFDAMCEARAEFVAPAADRLITDNDTALEQLFFNITQAKLEPEIPPNRETNDCRGEPVAVIKGFSFLHRDVLRDYLANVTVPALGVHYLGRPNWGPTHRRWLSTFAFDSTWQQLAFNEHRRAFEDRLAQCELWELALHEERLNHHPFRGKWATGRSNVAYLFFVRSLSDLAVQHFYPERATDSR